jgi:PAS domain S-box-containing protein
VPILITADQHVFHKDDILAPSEYVKTSTVYDISRQLVVVFDLEELYSLAAKAIQQAVGASIVGNGTQLELRAIATSGIEGYDSYKIGQKQSIRNDVIERAITSGRMVLTNGQQFGQSETNSRLCLPVRFDDVDYGVLDIQMVDSGAFSPENVQAMETVSSFLAVAISNIYRYLQISQDLRGQSRVDEALHLSEERFRQVVASISAHVYVTEVTEDDRLINHYISPNVETLTGYLHREFIDDWSFWPRKVIFLDDQPIADHQFDNLRRGHSSTVEYRLLRADNQIIWVRDSGRVETQGTSRMIYGVVSDITDRKEAEEALRRERALLAQRVAERTSELSAANAKLARASRLKDEFLANMGHELRTPLNAILGMAEVLQSGVYGELNQEQCKASQHIEESGKHLLSLITDILDLSKIEAEKLELEIGPTSPDYIGEASLRMVAQVARKKRIKVLSRYDERVKQIQVDQRRLKQILVNLLSNAVKFTPVGGQIGLYVQGEKSAEQVRFIVWDTGIGIAAEDIKRLFEPFVQLDSKLSRQHEGSGLGLSLVARLAEMHGGSVSVESEPEKGSRFTVSLPWHPADHITPAQADEEQSTIALRDHVISPQGAEAPLILLAEDNEANVVTITEFLQGLEYRVIVARNGFEAVERTTGERPDIIIMDVQMPGMDGLDAARQIRYNAATKHLPIIALTALAMPGDRERCLAAGMNEYLSKPVSLKKLMAVIEHHLKVQVTV